MKMTDKKPDWLKVKLPSGETFAEVHSLIRSQDLNTVCSSARCPNLSECWNNRTATFMILGDHCTRNCSFCAITSGKPSPPDPDEPRRVAQSVKALGLQYAVITSVTRDDLSDGGASHFASTIEQIRAAAPGCLVEVLISDLQGRVEALQTIFAALPDVLNHNLETVPDLYPDVRPKSHYNRSLSVLRKAASSGLRTKTGLMLGLGETEAQLIEVFRDIVDSHCRLLTLGQYLQPTRSHHPVVRYVHPDEFKRLAEIGMEMGFDHVEAGPLVRSSYHAHEQVEGVV
ncbi:lipoyl synthase [candidate division LCP-89 bacterium B3_LCP]|uniref:Lipoyl synthase n=1 Tax=candidate division LCP-89 bacterium B3_LCP TaxID=2012998 RepID=A0A532V391_UNCL8|nr:MAG: lipoyl synthase [candidate division LCP-89 bacterium B3_LCP]